MVRVRPRVVAVQIEHPSVRRVVPVAAAIAKPLLFDMYPAVSLLGCFHPPTQHFADLIQHFSPVLIFSQGKVLHVFIGCQANEGPKDIKFDVYFIKNRLFISAFICHDYKPQNFIH